MDPYDSPWSSKPANADSGHFYVPSDAQLNAYPHQYFSSGGYPSSIPPPTNSFNPVETPAFANHFAQNVALQYGSEALGQGKQIVQEKVQHLLYSI